MRDAFGIKAGYTARGLPVYADDPVDSAFQPDVYTLAGGLATMLQASRIIDIGCGSAAKLLPLASLCPLIGVDYGLNLSSLRARAPAHDWRECDLESVGLTLLTTEEVTNAVVICADVIEHLVNPQPLLSALCTWVGYAHCAVLSTPDRDSFYPATHFGPPENPAHVREWSRVELVDYLEAGGCDVVFSGLTRSHTTQPCQTTIALIRRRST